MNRNRLKYKIKKENAVSHAIHVLILEREKSLKIKMKKKWCFKVVERSFSILHLAACVCNTMHIIMTWIFVVQMSIMSWPNPFLLYIGKDRVNMAAPWGPQI